MFQNAWAADGPRGMCSVHKGVVILFTALQGITTAIAFQHGMGSSAFALAVALSSIVMYDAAGVRRHAGVSCWVHVAGMHAAGTGDGTEAALSP